MSTAAESGSPALNIEKCTVVLLDVAGTTTSINFVKDTLFPFVTKHVEDFLKEKWEDETVKEAVKLLKDGELDLAAATAAVKELTEQNSENKGLKTIQGLIYKKGYESGDLKAHIFPDVAASLEAWAKSRKVAIYSTGSTESQQLLFSHTAEGDVSSHISKYFDQSAGAKTESTSYENIAKALEVKAEEIVFVTDSAKEAEAAKTAGVVPVLVKREGNEDISEDAAKTFPVITDFKEIVFENSAKRKNVDETAPSEEQPPTKLAKTETTDDKATAAESPAEVTPQVDEKMEVDTPTEPETAATEEKPDDKPTEAATEDKTETEPVDKKTEEASPAEEPKPEKTEETPMETAETEKVEEEEKSDKQEETEEKKEETVKAKEAPKEEKTETEAETKVEEKVEEKAEEEKMEAEDSVEADKEAATTVETKDDTTETKEETATTETKDDAAKSETKQEIKETSEVKEMVAETKEEEVKETSKAVAKQQEDKETKEVTETKEVEMKKESTSESKEEKIEEKVEAKAENSKTEETAEEAKEKVAPSKEEEKEEVKPAEKTVEEPKVEKEQNGTEEKAESTEEKAESSEACPKEASEASSSEAVASKDEKENKSELANGVENGEAEKSEAVNGDAEEKQNGEAKAEESSSKVEDIKVKKIEETPDSTPAVSVEV